MDLYWIFRICHLTRTDSLSIFAFENREEDDIETQGIGGDGTLTGVTGISQKPKDRCVLEDKKTDEFPFLLPTFDRARDFRGANVFVNFEAAKDFSNLRNVEEWVALLDGALKEQLTLIAKEKLGFDPRVLPGEAMMPLLWIIGMAVNKPKIGYLAWMFLAFYMIDHGYQRDELLKTYVFLCGMAKFSGFLEELVDSSSEEEGRKSLVNPLTLGDFEYERLLVFYYTLATRKLVSVAVPDEKNGE